MVETSDRMATGTVREVFEGCFEGGAVVSYRCLRLECLEWSPDPQPWRVFRDGEWVASIRPAAYPSSAVLQRDLDALAEGDVRVPDGQCASCPRLPTPGD